MIVVLTVKLVSLFFLIWFGVVLLTKVARNQHTHWLNIAIPSAAVVAFAWSMGWLS